MCPVHVRAETGDFAESVLLPGDPLRARYIAETFFEDTKLVTEERGMLGYTGTYRGKPVSVQSTGMGCPSAGIVIEELVQLGRSEEHTSELQSRQYLVCRLLLEKKKKMK